MDKIFCVHCGYVFGEDGDGGRDSVVIMLEAEKNFERCPKCASQLELSIGDDPASTVSLMQETANGNRQVLQMGNRYPQNQYGLPRPGQSSRPSLPFLITLVVLSFILSQILRGQPWWGTASTGMQIGIFFGSALIIVAIAYGIDRLFQKSR